MDTTNQMNSELLIYGFTIDSIPWDFEALESKNIRIVYTSNFIDFQNKVNQSQHLVGLLVLWDSQCQEEEGFFKTYRNQCFFINCPNKSSIPGASYFELSSFSAEHLLSYLEGFKHPHLAEWMTECASFLLPFHTPRGPIQFKEVKTPINEPDQHQPYRIELNLTPYRGVIYMTVNQEKFQEEISKILGIQEDLLDDFLRELLNQFAGVLTRPFYNYFQQPSVSVPECLTDTLATYLAKDPFWPFSQIEDNMGLFTFYVGVIHTQGGGPFKAAMDNAWDPIQSLEFL